MSFRVEFPLGGGRPQFWECACDFCELVGHLSLREFPDFPCAFEHVIKRGWDVVETARGTRYACPGCAPQEEV